MTHLPPAADVDVQLDSDDHPLVVAVRQGEPVEVLRAIQVRMAEIAATMAFIAEHPGDYDLVEDGRALTREVRLLKRLAELVAAERRTLGSPPPGPGHPLVRRVVDLFVRRILDIADEALPADSSAELERRLRQDLAAHPEVPWP